MNIAWLIVALLIVIVAQGIIYSKWGLRRITYQRDFTQKTVFEGEAIEMVDEIANYKLLPIPWLRLETKMSPHLVPQKEEEREEGEVFHRTLFSFFPYQKITRRHQLVGGKRGYYPLTTVAVTVGDVLGYSEEFDSFNAETAVTVYPKITNLDEIPLPSHSWLGDITVRRWIMEDPFLHAGVREYEQGDPLHTVNWKATARTQSLQVNKKDFTADHHLMIYVNFDVDEDIRMPMTELETMEKALTYAATLATYTIDQGIATGFGCNGYYVEPFVNSTDRIKPSVRVEPSASDGQKEFILDAIAKVKMDRSRNFRAFLEEDIEMGREDTDILIFTYQMTEKVAQQITRLQEQGNDVETVILASEEKRGEQHAS
ncbi:uncharacterized protein (DUF58 family) [Gracilibacillus halotolerans]|uniref:Uncharacterized protein (DUF58 family) n=1 Tax=Gracilibacillus halotolerans TaxID=74386 RepID=A0A841RII7_9BACI|nr:DUF58 domain-containing protein [Gracilibacillus halotolerans]MBB6512299.1 uncharacterized protein (DUF58 family) [Gracilibacillus halotolerans]